VLTVVLVATAYFASQRLALVKGHYNLPQAPAAFTDAVFEVDTC
jgi:hypothetical protein